MTIWTHYVPGIVAAVGGATLLCVSPQKRSVVLAGWATLLGLICMEGEYWVAHGFPWSEVPFFVATAVLTLTAIALGSVGCAALGILGLVFFAYVNLRYGAPYLLDYILPVLYAVLLVRSRYHLNWQRSGFFRAGALEGLWIVVTYGLTLWRTSSLDKWEWITGGPW